MPTHVARLQRMSERMALHADDLAETSRFYRDEVHKIREEERWRLSCRLHDKSAQELFAASLFLSEVNRTCSGCSTKGAHQTLCEVAQLIGEVLKELRCLSYLLSPVEVREHGLFPSIDKLLSNFSFRTGKRPKLLMRSHSMLLTEEVGVALYMILEEFLALCDRSNRQEGIEMYLLENSEAVRMVLMARTGDPAGEIGTSRPAQSITIASIQEYAGDMGGSAVRMSAYPVERIVVTIPKNDQKAFESEQPLMLRT